MALQTPRVIFAYNKDKDAENIQIGFQPIKNGREPDAELKQIIRRFGNNPSDADITLYLEERRDGKERLIHLAVRQLQEYWDSIEERFFLHLADRMKLSASLYEKDLAGYFSFRYGSGYRSSKNWFAVSIHSGTLRNTLTAMHEIMHIYFHKQWWNFCKEKGLSDKNTWDVKEAVTVLLNLWMKEWVVDVDWGYKEHAELRRFIKEWFLETRDFETMVLRACEYAKNNPQKSPNWITN